MCLRANTAPRFAIFTALFSTLLALPLLAGVPDTTNRLGAANQPPLLDTTAVVDTTATNSIPTPPQEAVNLSAHGAFTNLSPRVGDSLDYVLQVEWEESQVPVMVLAPDSMVFAGFKVLGQATVHKKLASAEAIRNHTEFIYRLRAQIQGSGRLSSLKVRYITGLSGHEEALFVAPSMVDILPAPVHLMDRLWFKLLAALVLFGAAVLVAWSAFKFTLRLRKKPEPAKLDLTPEIGDLKKRLKSAASSPDAAREILLAMESIGIQYLQQAVKIQGNMKFEPLLEKFLSNATDHDTSNLQDWEKLTELFRHAHFAGGYKEPHELQDAFKTFKRCLKITGEDEHE